MRKILILLVLCLGTLSFSTTGFKNLKWGTSKEEAIRVMGEPNYSKGQIIQYGLNKFDNIYLRFVTLKFDNGKLVAWEGAGFVSESQLNVLIEHFQKKYKGFSAFSDNDKKFSYSDTKGYIYLSYSEEYGELSIKYDSKEYRDKEYKKIFGNEEDL